MPFKAVIFDLDGTITRPYFDFDAIRRGYISITPIHVDLTRYQALDQISGWVSEVSFDQLVKLEKTE